LCIRAKIKRIFTGKRIKEAFRSKNISYELTDADRRLEGGRYSII
jgi:hypothetical protein